ncbi:MAG TPA: magnesium/cobalt efflux protein, partial [Gammaproteobacteria bacterium]|nr:magnesium/cobalt efflux protein [Gammaproteobacteria bacterium]
MKQDRSSNSVGRLSWLDRLSQTLLGKPKNREQLIHILREAQHRGLFDADAQGMIEGVLQVAEIQARDIMIPRSQMVVVSREDSPEELVPVAIQSGHSRFPVVGDSRDEVVGVLLA